MTPPHATALRRFGLQSTLFLLLLAVVVARHHQATQALLLTLSGMLLGAALLVPHTLQRVHQASQRIGAVIGQVNARVVLGFVFICMITPTAMLLRRLHKQPLAMGFDRKRTTYRVIRTPRSPSHVKHQF
jgi:hypothetical protein